MITVRILLGLALLTQVSIASIAQGASNPSFSSYNKKEKKPYKVLTSGKQITIKATSAIKSVMVWTSSGHRIVEQKEVKSNSFTFRISVNEKIFFVMLRLEDGRHFTEKIGI